MSQRLTKVGYGAALLLALSAWQCGRTQPPPTPAPLADYGDAPDGQPAGYRTGPGTGREGKFPSLFNSPNVRLAGNRGIAHLASDPELRFGRQITVERDALITDQDADDGRPTLIISDNGNMGSLLIDVQARDGNRDEEVSGFVNALLDLNQDGVWRQHQDGTAVVDEWLVVNHPVKLRRGRLERITLPSFTYGPSSVRVETWGRLTITSAPIAPTSFTSLGGWDGSASAAGLSDGETEDWRFPCEGRLKIDYPTTADDFTQRLTNPGVAPAAPAPIVITNTAAQTVTYVFMARGFVAVPFGLGYFYVPLNSANPEFAMSLRPLVVPPAGVTVSPIPATLAPEQLITITMPAGAVVTLGLSATATPANNGVLDPTRPPKPPGADNRMGYVEFHPLGPCLLGLQKTNNEPVYVQSP